MSSELIFEHYAHGKLLLSGEYFVLDGAIALAVPAKFGQYFRVYSSVSSSRDTDGDEVSSSRDTNDDRKESKSESHTAQNSSHSERSEESQTKPTPQNGILRWKSFNSNNEIWFEGEFSIANELSIVNTSDNETAENLLKILNAALHISGLTIDDGLEIHTSLEFPNNWGLGSSSTLIASISDWFEIDAYELLDQSFGGSGYDLACAVSDSPIFFERKPNEIEVTSVELNYPFKDHICFVHLGKKQNSREGIKHYRKLPLKDKQQTINKLSDISEALSTASNVEDFINLIEEHENILSRNLQLPKVKDLFFSDFNGDIKSLGAWGGDFVMVVGKDKEGLKAYFEEKGYSTVISYEEMVY